MLYLFAVLPVAAIWGLPFAIPVSIVSMLAFNWFFLPPKHTFRLADSENWVALAVYLVTAISVSALAAARAGGRTEAEQRRREATLGGRRLGDPAREPSRSSPDCLETSLLGPRAFSASSRAGSSSMDAATRERDELARARTSAALRCTDRGSEPPRRLARSRRRSTVEARAVLRLASSRRRSSEPSPQRRREDGVLRSVSHDLRSPITAIMAASEMLADRASALRRTERARRIDPRAGAAARPPRREPARAFAARGRRGPPSSSCGRSTGWSHAHSR